jgi:putative DNA-invertase from lambdoid prophage Rac
VKGAAGSKDSKYAISREQGRKAARCVCLGHRGWSVVRTVQEIASGAAVRPERADVLKAALQRECDVVLVWKLDRWGRSISDLIGSIRDLAAAGVIFASVTDAIDISTPTGKAMVAFLATFAEFERDLLRERVKAGMTDARKQGKHIGRPSVPVHVKARILNLLDEQRLSQAEIATEVGVSRATVARINNVTRRLRPFSY